MKTHYQELYEYLTPLLVTGRITSTEMAVILAKVQLLETRVKVLEGLYHDAYAESKREDLQQEAEREINDNVTIKHEGDE